MEVVARFRMSRKRGRDNFCEYTIYFPIDCGNFKWFLLVIKILSAQMKIAIEFEYKWLIRFLIDMYIHIYRHIWCMMRYKSLFLRINFALVYYIECCRWRSAQQIMVTFIATVFSHSIENENSFWPRCCMRIECVARVSRTMLTNDDLMTMTDDCDNSNNANDNDECND